MNRDELIRGIVESEWQMFTTTHSAGGRASCQDDRQTFEIMRSSQMNAWNEDTLESYSDDLHEAVRTHTNLIEQKYAWMMASTHPNEFAKIEHLLPRQSEQKKELIERIVARQMTALEAMRPRFPHVMACMRRLHTKDDTPDETSLETYQRGEFYTYSYRTLQCFERQIAERQDYGRTILEDTARQYGYSSLDALEEALRRTAVSGS